jgi:hypothetical protein
VKEGRQRTEGEGKKRGEERKDETEGRKQGMMEEGRSRKGWTHGWKNVRDGRTGYNI